MNKYLYKFTDISIKHRLDLFDKLIVPILCYGAAVWGFIQAPAIEQVHLRFLKTILRVKTSTSNDFVYAGLFVLFICITTHDTKRDDAEGLRQTNTKTYIIIFSFFLSLSLSFFQRDIWLTWKGCKASYNLSPPLPLFLPLSLSLSARQLTVLKM